jgi:poly(hydroxyalkanoate) granule-associated protein
MMAKKKAKELQMDLMDSAHKVWLAGLGALALAEEEGGKLFSSLVDRGEDLEKKGKQQVDKARGAVTGVKTVAESYWDTFERTLDDKVTGVIHRLGVPTKDEIETLTTKVEDLTTAIEKMRASGAAKPAAKPAAAKKTAAKSRSTSSSRAKTAKK